jgi:hypothetical protein
VYRRYGDMAATAIEATKGRAMATVLPPIIIVGMARLPSASNLLSISLPLLSDRTAGKAIAARCGWHDLRCILEKKNPGSRPGEGIEPGFLVTPYTAGELGMGSPKL